MSTPCYIFFRYDSTLDSINAWLNRVDDPPVSGVRPFAGPVRPSPIPVVRITGPLVQCHRSHEARAWHP